ncbi:MAG: hypothetical protein U5J78_03475 [Parasphingorhabdus sp.]|nr:hypothetical protein [Parasphingorhabdus sp.]
MNCPLAVALLLAGSTTPLAEQQTLQQIDILLANCSFTLALA